MRLLSRTLVISLLVIAPTSVASVPLLQIERLENGEGRAKPLNSWTARTLGVKLWDNWSDASDGGITLLDAPYRIGGDEIGEICHGVAGKGGVLGDLAFTLYNFSATGTITRFRENIRVYSASGELLTSVSFLISTWIPSGTGAGMRFGEDSLLGIYGNIPDDFIMTLQFSQVSGIELSDVGVFSASPITAGTSPAFSLNRSTGNPIDLPGDNHFAMFAHTLPIPCPQGLAVLCGVAHAVLRRRR